MIKYDSVICIAWVGLIMKHGTQEKSEIPRNFDKTQLGIGSIFLIFALYSSSAF